MKLAVIQTCGECEWSKCRTGHYSGSRARGCQHPEAGALPILHGLEPPLVCPIRTGPDEERLAALEAVADAAARVDSLAYRAKLTGDDWMSLTRALRKLREASGG